MLIVLIHVRANLSELKSCNAHLYECTAPHVTVAVIILSSAHLNTD